ncbi:hypothetical protein WS66_26530 [Burkholderia sp. LA-2-3-30-S1-D2]|nr:hypothetical protein WS66_26530 [Burkholderia sp. LA-2-3-30-S1-D2]KVE18166.1 hypothetical protein WS66_31595 [Burkholderia sp. LA-2-3-30-S1-D2]
MVTSGPVRCRAERRAIAVAHGNGCAVDYSDRRARLPAIAARRGRAAPLPLLRRQRRRAAGSHACSTR